MTSKTARIALSLSLMLALAACGGGGGGGGNDDDDDDGNPPPAGFGDFDGSFTLRSTNVAGQSFDRTVPAAFVDGEGTVAGVATDFDYPVDATTGGCFYDGAMINHCVERAQGNLLALCTASDATEISVVGIRNDAGATIAAVDLEGLKNAAGMRAGAAGLQFQAMTCANTLDATDMVTIQLDGNVIQNFRGMQGTIPPSQSPLLFGPDGLQAGGANSARLGSRGLVHTVNGVTTYYVVNFGAPNSGSGDIKPKLFVSIN